MGFKKTGPVEIVQVLDFEKSIDSEVIALEEAKKNEKKEGKQNVLENS